MDDDSTSTNFMLFSKTRAMNMNQYKTQLFSMDFERAYELEQKYPYVKIKYAKLLVRLKYKKWKKQHER